MGKGMHDGQFTASALMLIAFVRCPGPRAVHGERKHKYGKNKHSGWVGNRVLISVHGLGRVLG